MELPFLFLNPWKLKSSIIVGRSGTSCLQKLLSAGEAVHNHLSVGPFPGLVLSQFLGTAPGQDARSPAFRYFRLVHGSGSLQLVGVYSRSSPSLSVIKQLYDGKSGSWKVGRGMAAGLREVCTKRPFPACLRALCRLPWLVCTHSVIHVYVCSYAVIHVCVCYVAWSPGRETPVRETVFILEYHKEFRVFRGILPCPWTSRSLDLRNSLAHMPSNWIKPQQGCKYQTLPSKLSSPRFQSHALCMRRVRF